MANEFDEEMIQESSEEEEMDEDDNEYTAQEQGFLRGYEEDRDGVEKESEPAEEEFEF
ncbi:MAG TPA: hypothetical protein VKE88_03620 [Candidatus Nanoarchaeia archaeon]|nr:hypothetical protein [Candidatus Nanoarchaeia archaeon]